MFFESFPPFESVPAPLFFESLPLFEPSPVPLFFTSLPLFELEELEALPPFLSSLPLVESEAPESVPPPVEPPGFFPFDDGVLEDGASWLSAKLDGSGSGSDFVGAADRTPVPASPTALLGSTITSPADDAVEMAGAK